MDIKSEARARALPSLVGMEDTLIVGGHSSRLSDGGIRGYVSQLRARLPFRRASAMVVSFWPHIPTLIFGLEIEAALLHLHRA